MTEHKQERKRAPAYEGTLRSHMVTAPRCIAECSGIRVFGRQIKSLAFTTDVPIIATGGPTEEDILTTIRAGANAITYTPPSSGELFARSMERYRREAEII